MNKRVRRHNSSTLLVITLSVLILSIRNCQENQYTFCFEVIQLSTPKHVGACDPGGLASSPTTAIAHKCFHWLLSDLHATGADLHVEYWFRFVFGSSIEWIITDISLNWSTSPFFSSQSCQGFWTGSAVETVTAMLTGGRGETPSLPLLLEFWYFTDSLI